LLPRMGIAQQNQGATANPMQIRLNLPGPGSLPFLPLELIPALGFDAEMGTRLLLRYHPSGIRALEDMFIGNADFAALGFPTLPVLHAKGKDAVAIAPISGTQHTFHMIVRKDLAGTITRLQDLKGHTIGVSTGSPNSKTYMQMLTEILLGAHGVGNHQIRWLATGQNWESASGALISKAADAVFCEQPFPTRLIRAGLGVSLADLSDARINAKVAGVDALRSIIATSRALLHQPEGPNKADLMVRMLRRSLVWLQSTSPETVARHAVVRAEEEREDIAILLKKTPGIYSTDARFITRQIETTDQFLRAAQSDMKLVPAAGLVDDRWAGRKT
jgi:ABC-type nitrate/sulfonate/bicarbonate transport system substrate-binding protein